MSFETLVPQHDDASFAIDDDSPVVYLPEKFIIKNQWLCQQLAKQGVSVQSACHPLWEEFENAVVRMYGPGTMNAINLHRNELDEYVDDEVRRMWQGYLMAKGQAHEL